MLQRLLGEHIELKTMLDARRGWIGLTGIDGGRAHEPFDKRARRHAGGRGSIYQHEQRADPGHGKPRKRAAPGSYDCLTVADTGADMDAKRSDIFEPFFTTRGKGRRHRIIERIRRVQHNGGRIFVSRELGNGTVFTIYLPTDEQVAIPEQARITEEVRRGTENLLCGRPNPEGAHAARSAEQLWLSRLGSGDGLEALENWGSRVAEIDLLITDVVMPVMNGKKLPRTWEAPARPSSDLHVGTCRRCLDKSGYA